MGLGVLLKLPGLDPEIPSLGGGYGHAHDEVRASGREEDLAVCPGERREQRLGSLWIELAGDVIEQQDGLQATGGGDAVELGDLEGQGDGPVLPLGADGSSRVAIQA